MHLPLGVALAAVLLVAAGPSAPAHASGEPLAAVLERLDHARLIERRALRQATADGARARIARRLAAAHLAASRNLQPLAGPGRRRLQAALTRAASAYTALADATGSRTRYRAARRAVARSDARLVAAVQSLGHADRPAPAPTARPSGHGPRVPLLVLALTAAAAAMLLRRARPAPVPPVAPPPWRPSVSRRSAAPRRPAPPPPAGPAPAGAVAGRWDGSRVD